MSLPEKVEDFVSFRTDKLHDMSRSLELPRRLEDNQLDITASLDLAALYVDYAAVIRDAYIPAWNGMIQTLRQRTPSFWIVLQNHRYDITGRCNTSYRNAELLWGFASIETKDTVPVRTRRYIGLHALPDRDHDAFDAVATMPDRRQKQRLKRLGAFRDWFCSHANIIEMDVRHTPFYGLTPDQKATQQISFFNVPSMNSPFSNPKAIDYDLCYLSNEFDPEFDAAQTLRDYFALRNKRNSGYMYEQAKLLRAATDQINQSIDISVPDNGDVHFLTYRREWYDWASEDFRKADR